LNDVQLLSPYYEITKSNLTTFDFLYLLSIRNIKSWFRMVSISKFFETSRLPGSLVPGKVSVSVSLREYLLSTKLVRKYEKFYKILIYKQSNTKCICVCILNSRLVHLSHFFLMTLSIYRVTICLFVKKSVEKFYFLFLVR